MCALRQPRTGAQAQLGITRANQFPTVNVNGTGASLRNSATVQSRRTNSIMAGWTLMRRGSSISGGCIAGDGSGQSAAAGDEWARQEVNATLVANVASAYFQLRELDLELDITKSAVAFRTESLQLTQTLESTESIDSGRRQAEQLVYTLRRKLPIKNGASSSKKISSSILMEIIRPPSAWH